MMRSGVSFLALCFLLQFLTLLIATVYFFGLICGFNVVSCVRVTVVDVLSA